MRRARYFGLWHLLAGSRRAGPAAQLRLLPDRPRHQDRSLFPGRVRRRDCTIWGCSRIIASEFRPPQLKHEVLVEGRIAEGPRVCGGIPLQPVSISVLKEVNLACNTLLPAEPGIDAPPALRAWAVSAPRRRSRVLRRHEFTVLYAFNDDYLEYAANLVVTEAAAYAKRDRRNQSESRRIPRYQRPIERRPSRRKSRNR